MPTKSNVKNQPLRITDKKVLVLTFILALVVTTSVVIYSTRFTPSSDTAFSVVWVTDTQNSVGGYSNDFDLMCSWIVKNSASLNLKTVIHTGDIVNYADDSGQWVNANHSMGILMNNNISYCWNAGNHDKVGTTWYGKNYTAFDTNVTRGKQYWVDDYHDGMNTAIALDFSNQSFLIINIEYQADIDVMQWTNSLLDRHPSSLAIVGTHSYLSSSCDYDQWGIDFKTNVLDTHKNVILTLSGHEDSLGNRTKGAPVMN